MEGWIKLHRSVLEWEWYDDANTLRLFFHCLLKANHSDKTWRGITVKRGEFITSYDALSKELRLTVKQIRTSLNKLKRTNELANKSTTQYTVIQVVKYDVYQVEDKQEGKPMANEGQTKGKQRATTKNDKNNKNKKNDKNIINNNLSDKPTLSPILKKDFLDFYANETGNQFYWTAKEATNLKQLISKLKFSIEEKKEKSSAKKESATDEEVISSFRIILENLPKWIKEKTFTIAGINSQYMNILNQIKNGSEQTDTIEEYFRTNFGI